MMAIPKVLYQTYSSYKNLPLSSRISMRIQRRHCPGYSFEFYDDERIEDFIGSEYGRDTLRTYRKIAIGAAKADFFRYAILYKRGGVYLDVDSAIKKNLEDLIEPGDEAVIAHEGNPWFFVQWALIYAPGHPFLSAALEKAIENIETNRHPRDVHKMTGPAVYSAAIHECLERDPAIAHRVTGVDYEGYFVFKQALSRLLYVSKRHWRHSQEHGGVLRAGMTNPEIPQEPGTGQGKPE